MEGSVPRFDYVIGGFKPVRSGHDRVLSRYPGKGAIRAHGFGKKVVFALDNQNHSIAIRVIEILVNNGQFSVTAPSAATFRIAYRASMKVRHFRHLLL